MVKPVAHVEPGHLLGQSGRATQCIRMMLLGCGIHLPLFACGIGDRTHRHDHRGDRSCVNHLQRNAFHTLGRSALAVYKPGRISSTKASAAAVSGRCAGRICNHRCGCSGCIARGTTAAMHPEARRVTRRDMQHRVASAHIQLRRQLCLSRLFNAKSYSLRWRSRSTAPANGQP